MPLIVGNLKMNLETLAARDEYLQKAKEAFGSLTTEQKKSLVICPPHLYIESFLEVMKAIDISIGAQDTHSALRGSHTGETSPKVLREIGATYVIIGHSERRAAGESEDDVIAKVKTATEVGITPILCVGHTPPGAEESDAVVSLIMSAAQVLSEEEIAKLIIAYEPVWAIGSGKTPTNEDIHTMKIIIRKSIAEVYPDIAGSIPILYGGSVTPENVKTICTDGHADGVLVGGASLDPENLARMAKVLSD